MEQDEDAGPAGEFGVTFGDPNDGDRPSRLCLGCILAGMLLVMFFYLDSTANDGNPSVARDPKVSPHGQEIGGPSSHGLLSKEFGRVKNGISSNSTSRRHEAFDKGISYTLTFRGKYVIYRAAPIEDLDLLKADMSSDNVGRPASMWSPKDEEKEDEEEEREFSPAPDTVLLGGRAVRPVEVETGDAHLLLTTKRTVINSIRLTNFRVVLVNSVTRLRQQITLGGLDLRDVKNFVYHGRTHPDQLYSIFAPLDSSGKYVARPRRCAVSAVIRFNKSPKTSQSIRPLDPSLSVSAGGRGRGDEEGSAWRLLRGIPSRSLWHHRNLKANNNLTVMETVEQRWQKDLWDEEVVSGGFEGEDLEGRQLDGKEEVLEEDDATGGASADGSEPQSGKATGNAKESSRVNLRPVQDLEGQVMSSDCGFWIGLSAKEVDIVELSSRVIKFSFAFNVKVLLEMRCFLSQMAEIELGRGATTISLGTLSMHLFVDALEGLFLMSTGLNSNFMLSSFVVMALFKLMLIMVEMRFFLIVWRAHCDAAHQGSVNVEDLQRESGILIRRLMGGLFAVVVSVYKVFPLFQYILIPLYLFWTPQIVWDVWKGQRRSLALTFLVGLSLCRLALPLYSLGLPPSHSIFDGEVFDAVHGAPSITFCVVICVIVAIQVALSVGQRFYGSRFFVPSRWLPKVYNYYRAIPTSKGDAAKKAGGKGSDTDAVPSASDAADNTLECVICMGDIQLKDRRRVVTPCDHFFHETCLRQWMDVKLECPTCRGLLPPFA